MFDINAVIGSRRAMTSKAQIVVNSLYDLPPCGECAMRLRFGDYKCPWCGYDIDDDLHRWAEELLRKLDTSD